MKFEIIKGNEADFKGAPDWALYVDVSMKRRFWSEGYKVGDRFKATVHGVEHKYDGNESQGSKVIAERRPIAEPQPDADGWIEWQGGECPVPAGTLIDLKFRRGLVNEKVKALMGGPALEGMGGGTDYWIHHGAAYDIIAYRLLKPEQPAAPTWNGEALPPVGVECEVRSTVIVGGKVSWKKLKVIAVNGSDIFGYLDGSPYAINPIFWEFRPIRSPKDIKRDEAIQQMSAATRKAESEGDVFGILYDAGYRKTE